MVFIFDPPRLTRSFVENKREKYKPPNGDRTVEAVFIEPLGPKTEATPCRPAEWVLADAGMLTEGPGLPWDAECFVVKDLRHPPAWADELAKSQEPLAIR